MLKGKYVELIPYDERHIDYLYMNIIKDNIEGFENCKIKQKKDLYEFMNNKRKYIKMFIKNINDNRINGYVEGYNYNKIDGYIYITTIIENNEKFNNEAIILFIKYLFTYFPIRKIYCEVVDNHLEKIELFKKLGFMIEANLEEDTFFCGNYYNKNILSLYREDLENG